MSEVAEPSRGQAYPGATVAAAVLATLFFPLISLIVALVLLGRERDPARRGAIRTWAWASGGWIAAQVVLFIVLAAVVFSSASSGGAAVDRSGPCQGGPQMDKAAEMRPDGSAV